jgi:hypothetical protein
VTPDLVNGAFEACGALVILLSVRRLLRDREVRGFDWRTTAFFSAWGLWNLFYYPSLDQWASFAGGVAIVLANTAWLCLLARYAWLARRKRERWRYERSGNRWPTHCSASGERLPDIEE